MVSQCVPPEIILSSSRTLDISAQAEVGKQAVQAAFPAEPAFLVAAKRTRRVELVVGIGPDNSRPEFAHHFEDLAAFVSPDAGAQSVRNVVGPLERFLRSPEGHNTQDGSEYLLLRHPVGHRNPGQKGGWEPITPLR